MRIIILFLVLSLLSSFSEIVEKVEVNRSSPQDIAAILENNIWKFEEVSSITFSFDGRRLQLFANGTLEAQADYYLSYEPCYNQPFDNTKVGLRNSGNYIRLKSDIPVFGLSSSCAIIEILSSQEFRLKAYSAEGTIGREDWTYFVAQ